MVSAKRLGWQKFGWWYFSNLHCLKFWSHHTMVWYLQKKLVLKKFWHWYFSQFWPCHTVGVPVDPSIAKCCNQNSWLFSKMIFQIGGDFKFSPDGTTTTLRRTMMRGSGRWIFFIFIIYYLFIIGRWMSRATSTLRPHHHPPQRCRSSIWGKLEVSSDLENHFRK